MDRRYHQRLHNRLIKRENRPCQSCGAFGERDIHRLIPEKGYKLANVRVLCIPCHKEAHYQGKFRVGDRVYLNGRTPEFVELARHRPRTVHSVRYDAGLQANVYTLGSNGRVGDCPRDGYSYEFRSYQLHAWNNQERNGRPRKRRSYHRKNVIQKSNGCQECRSCGVAIPNY